MSLRLLGLPVALSALLASGSGCFLPVSTAAPQSSVTVGKGNVGATVYGEFPTVDLLATQTDDDLASDQYALAPMPTTTLQLGYGITDRLDLEVAIDGVIYIILPLPLGGSLGGRFQLVDHDDIAVAASGKVGYVGLGVNDQPESDPDGEVGVSAAYAAVSLSTQLRPRRLFRPGAALTFMPARVTNEVKGETAQSFSATTASLTVTAGFGVGALELGPFVNLIYFRSPNLRGTATLITGGFMIALRGQRTAPARPLSESIDRDEWPAP